MTSKQKAETIRNQFGGRALFMIDADCLVAHENGSLSFRFKCSKIANYVKITPNKNDLYDLKFMKIWGRKYNIIKEINDVGVGNLHKVFEETTNLKLSLQ